MNPTTDTIAALATPPGESGLALIRVSGRDACPIASRVFRTPAGREKRRWTHRRAYPGRVIDSSESTIDDVVVTVFRAPKSYTGEDVVEISCHGSPVGTHRVLAALLEAGAHAAQAGEFTRRAFLNGKLDLIQAEAVAELIHARSELQQHAAHRQLAGGLSGEIGRLAGEMLSIRAEIEANIDFVEEDIDTLSYADLAEVVRAQGDALLRLVRGAAMTRRFYDGFHVVLSGAVNAGKSSLFNRLLERERAIVTEIPGTTRDVLREGMTVDGLVFVLHDTAGVRESTDDDAVDDRVEAIGVDRAREALRGADVVIEVVDGSRPVPAARTAARLDVPRVVAVNKSDLCVHPDAVALFAGAGVEHGVETVAVSAKTGEGIDALRTAVLRAAGGDDVSRAARERFVINARVSAALETARGATQRLARGLDARAPLELLAADAREALRGYETATGARYEEGLLDEIFSRFCLGK